MAARYEVDYTSIEQLERKLEKIPDTMEQAINEVLHIEGVEIATEEITKDMSVSNRHKNHAKYSNWSESRLENLGFTIVTRGGAANKKGSFGYLVFPEQGRGRSNPQEQRFMRDGLERATPKIIERLHVRIDKVLEEVFK